MSEVATPARLHDLGNLLLAFVMLWAYMSFSQFLIIWAGNLTEEMPWYIRRTHGGWQWVALLLDRASTSSCRSSSCSSARASGSRELLLRVAWLVLVMHLVDLIWLVIPASADVTSPRIPWGDLPLDPGRDGGHRRHLGRRPSSGSLKGEPLIPLNDPRPGRPPSNTREATDHGGHATTRRGEARTSMATGRHEADRRHGQGHPRVRPGTRRAWGGHPLRRWASSCSVSPGEESKLQALRPPLFAVAVDAPRTAPPGQPRRRSDSQFKEQELERLNQLWLGRPQGGHRPHPDRSGHGHPRPDRACPGAAPANPDAETAKTSCRARRSSAQPDAELTRPRSRRKP